MNRKIVTIENACLDLNVYYEEEFQYFDFSVLTSEIDGSFVINEKDALELSDSISESLGDTKTDILQKQFDEVSDKWAKTITKKNDLEDQLENSKAIIELMNYALEKRVTLKVDFEIIKLPKIYVKRFITVAKHKIQEAYETNKRVSEEEIETLVRFG